MKYRTDQINVAEFSELHFWRLNRTGDVSPRTAFEALERDWRCVDNAKMSNDDRMPLIELIDEFGGGVFEPFMDTFGKVRDRVIVELKVAYDTADT